MHDLNELIEDCKKRNHSAFETLYKRYASKMKGVAYRYVSDSAKAEDVLHDAFIIVYEKLHTLRDNSVFEGWLRRIVVNEALDLLKKEKKLNKVIAESGQLSSDSQSDNYTPYENISVKELMEALNTLPTGYRTIFHLHIIDGYQHKEIAEKLGITEGTSKSQLAKAKEYLKNKLKKHITLAV